LNQNVAYLLADNVVNIIFFMIKRIFALNIILK